jgi:hypothetical protein
MSTVSLYYQRVRVRINGCQIQISPSEIDFPAQQPGVAGTDDRGV